MFITNIPKTLETQAKSAIYFLYLMLIHEIFMNPYGMRYKLKP